MTRNAIRSPLGALAVAVLAAVRRRLRKQCGAHAVGLSRTAVTVARPQQRRVYPEARRGAVLVQRASKRFWA